ncbi:MAG: hypothetical protein HKP31_01640 [Nitrosopumilus sp.]|nr:hypothetical protein [Nitrosopumilus sp.]
MKTLNLPFDSILPEEILNYSGNLVLTTKQESPKKCKKPVLHEDIFENHPTVIKGLMMQKLNLDFLEEDLILGVDPGKRIGLSIFYYGKEIESIFHSSVEDLVFHVIGVLGGLRAKRKIVKIGNGDMKIAQQIATMLNLKFCSSYDLEFVDERKTSLKIKNFNQRGKRDMLSAKYISQRDGYRHSILPLSITG